MTENQTGAKAEAEAVKLAVDPKAEKAAQAEVKSAVAAADKAGTAADKAAGNDTKAEDTADTKTLEAQGKAADAANELATTLRQKAIEKAEREQAVPAAQREANRRQGQNTEPEYLHFGGLSKNEAETQYYATDIGHL